MPPTNALTTLLTQAGMIQPNHPLFTHSEDPSLAIYTALPTVESTLQLVDLPINAEDDDALHRPTSFEGVDDDEAGDRCIDLCSLRALLNVGGLLLMTLGVLAVFIGLPIVAYIQRAAAQTS